MGLNSDKQSDIDPGSSNRSEIWGELQIAKPKPIITAPGRPAAACDALIIPGAIVSCRIDDRSSFLIERDFFGKPVSGIPDYALTTIDQGPAQAQDRVIVAVRLEHFPAGRGVVAFKFGSNGYMASQQRRIRSSNRSPLPRPPAHRHSDCAPEKNVFCCTCELLILCKCDPGHRHAHCHQPVISTCSLM